MNLLISRLITVALSLRIQNLLAQWELEVLQCPPYSSDLYACDFDLIRKLKKPLGRIHFRTREDIATLMKRESRIFSHLEAESIWRLPHLWQRVVAGRLLRRTVDAKCNAYAYVYAIFML